MRKALLVLTAFAIGWLCLSSSCSKKAPPDAPFLKGYENSDVILVVIDALRADRMTPHYMPGIHSLIDENGAVVFSKAVSQAPWTAPSVASLFTGLHPVVHRVLAPNDGADGSLSLHTLADEFHTLSESFSRSGYRTAAYVPNGWINSHLGFAQGFDLFEDLTFKEAGETITARGLAWINSLAPGDRYFLYLHLMDVHGPYNAPPEYAEKFSGDHPDVELTREQYDMLMYLAKGPYEDPAARNLATYQKAYDAGAAYADEKLTRFLKAVFSLENGKRKPIVIIMADHGEAFFEHGFPDHGYTLYREETNVPLIIMAPGGLDGMRESDHVVEVVDVYPTLMEMTGIAGPNYRMSGISLSCALRNGPACEDRIAVSSSYIRGPKRVVVRTDSLKGIFYNRGESKDQDIEIFDLENDPFEKNDLSADQKLVDRATELLDKTFEANKASGPDQKNITHVKALITGRQLEKIKTLGYVK